MKKYLIAIILLISATIQAQNSLSGTVTDSENQPLKNVLVEIIKSDKKTTTDENGKYEIQEIPGGSLTIQFSADDFTTQNKTIFINQNKITLNVILEHAAFHLDEIIVSTAFNKVQSQNVMKVTHESIKSMQQRGASTLIEGLANLPGLSQVSTGASIGKPVIRGLSGNRVLVYSQGVRLENQQFGEEHGLGLNDSGVESVEVIKGPASLLYGSDALGGVLYFNPEKFAEKNTFKSDFSQKLFSNTLGSNTNIGAIASGENWKFLVRESYSTHSDYSVPTGDRVTNSRYNENDFKAAIGYSNDKTTSILRYNLNNLDLGIPEFDGDLSEMPQSKSKKTTFPKQGVTNHLLSWNNSFYFDNSSLDANIGYIFNDRKEFEDSDVAILQMKLKTLNYDLKYHLPRWGNSETIVGLQGMNQDNGNFGEEYLIPNAKTNDFGVYGTTRYDWNTNVIQAGIRFDKRNINSQEHGIVGEEGYFGALDRNFSSINASAGYKTNLAQKLTFRLNTASGFRAPNLAELTSNGVHEGSNRYEIGNPNLNNEQNVQTDLNLEYKNTHFEFFANGFYNHINNYIFISPTGTVIDENNVYQYTQADARLYGGETGIHFHPHPLDWLHIESSFEMVNGEKISGENLPLIPAKKWNNTLRTEFKINNWLRNGMATVNLQTYFDQKKVSDFETVSAGYNLLNLAVNGEIHLGKTIFNLNLNANNVLNQTYISHLSRLKVDGIPNMGRNIILGMNFNI
ncbi:MAG: TonB-dependent receptor domain-containing protein [Flavobacterium sp.]